MKRIFPLHVHISTIFLSVVLLVGGMSAWIGYRFSYDMLESSATDTTQRISQRLSNEIQGIVAPANLAADFLAYDPLSDARNFKQRWARLGVLREVLNNSNNFSAVYVGYASGDIFMMRPVRDEATQVQLGAPAGTRYFVKSIERSQGAAVGKYLYLNAALDVLREEARPDYVAEYDPRQRQWYQRGMAADGVVITPPYLFYSDRKVGLTVVKRTQQGDAVVGIDILLETVSDNLAQQKITANTKIAVVSADGDVLAHREKANLVKAPLDATASPRLKTLDELDIPAFSGLREVIKSHAHESAYNSHVSVAGEDWRLVVSQISIEGARPVYLVIVIPYRELFAEAFKLRDTSILFTALIMLVAIPLTWAIAKAVSRSLRLLAQEADSIRHFEFLAPIALRSSITEVNELAETMDGMKATIRRFLDVTQAVAAEESFERLLPKLLLGSLEAADAQAGVLYLVDEDVLLPTVALGLDGKDVVVGLKEVSINDDLPLLGMAARSSSALSGELSAAELAATGADVLIAKSFAPYSIVVPLINRQHQLVGMLLLQRKTPIDEAQLAFVNAVSSASSSSLETRELIKSQKDLFEAFIRIIAGAIDAKSPYTGGHCARVPELTKMLARAACDDRHGAFRDFQLDESGWESVHVAAWLHDCGKVTTPDFVVDKATKLETIYDRIHEVRMRFEVLKRDAEIICLNAIAAGEARAVAQAHLAETLQQLDDDFAFVAECNEGGESMAPEKVERLNAIAQRTWLRTLDDSLGVSHEEKERKATTAKSLPLLEPLLADKPEHRFARREHEALQPDNPWGFRMQVPELLYNRGELHNLSVSRGTLAAEDRYKINEHIVQTIIMLSQLPFPKHLRQVPEIAGGHHEKMDGTGYPRQLRKEDMSPVARMMAVADIFEALTAVDRPYKKGKTLSESIRIMGFMRKDQHIDPDVFDLFLRSGIYLDYAKRYMRPEQIDAVDVEQYLS